MADKYTLLRQYFGHTAFRLGQEEIIDNLLFGRDALCIMPTGAGKSICYQIPALLLSGVTLVISPLISLMKDQVTALAEMGIPAAFINSSLTAAQYGQVLSGMEAGQYKIVYVAPERLETYDFCQVARQIPISLLADQGTAGRVSPDRNPCTLKTFVNNLNDLAEDRSMVRSRIYHLVNWLVCKGYLHYVDLGDTVAHLRPAEEWEGNGFTVIQEQGENRMALDRRGQLLVLSLFEAVWNR